MYDINTHTIVVLITCYIYYKYINQSFSINRIRIFNTSYNYKRVKKYVLILVSKELITLAGVHKYTLTSLGLDIIKQISDNSYTIMYEFCQKYNIEL